MQVYCDTSVNRISGVLTIAQLSVGCLFPDDWTDITLLTKCAAGSTCKSAGGVGWTPPGYYYPNLEYDPVHHQVIQFAGLYGSSTVENQTWTYDMVGKTWKNMNPPSPPANSSNNNENGRVGHAFNTQDGKYYYHLTAHSPKVNNSLANPPEDWVYDPAANTWQQLSVGEGPQLLEAMTYDSGANVLVAWALHVDSDGIYRAQGIAEIWVGSFGAATAPTITSASPLTPGAINSPYSYTFSATGSVPITWSVTSGSLPPGLTLGSTGVLSGTPNIAGTYAFSLHAANSVASAGPNTFSLTISSTSTGSPPAITSTSPIIGATQNTSYSYIFAASGAGPIVWSMTSGTLPPGLSLSNTGILSGTPTGAGTYSFTVRATNSAGAAVPVLMTLTVAGSLSGPSALNIPLTIQEALYPGSINGVSRSNEPFCQGVPLADSFAIRNTSTLGLTGATAGQFRALGQWPSGNYKWIEVCGIIPSLSAGGATNVTLIGTGSGTFGGPALAVDKGSTITVSTGAATFTIRKAGFNVVDQVVIGSTTVVASGSSQGLVITGPNPTAAQPANVNCRSGAGQSPCTTTYSSAKDTNSQCTIEKNGQVVARS